MEELLRGHQYTPKSKQTYSLRQKKEEDHIKNSNHNKTNQYQQTYSLMSFGQRVGTTSEQKHTSEHYHEKKESILLNTQTNNFMQ